MRLPFVAAAAILSLASVEAATVTAAPSTDLATLSIGETFTVTLGAGADFDPFFGGAIWLTYDADVLSLVGGVAIDPPFMFSSLDAEPADATGSTTVTAMFSAFADQPAGTDFFTLTFAAEAVGASALTFSEATVGLMTGFINAASQRLPDIRFDGATAMVAAQPVQPIPLPAAGWMLLAGVGTLIAARRRA